MFYLDNSGSHGLEAKAVDDDHALDWDDAIAAASAYDGSGWHLPTKDELNLLYQQKAVVGGFADVYYWSSTKHIMGYAFVRDFRSGDDASVPMHNNNHARGVRAVRVF